MSKHKRVRRSLITAVTVLAVAASAVTVSAYTAAQSKAAAAPATTAAHGADNGAEEQPGPTSPRETRLQAARAQAIGKVLRGEAKALEKGSSKRVEYEKGKYVETARTTDRIFVLPVEFSDYAHNEIPKPDRTTDNSTVWASDYSQAYYQQQVFGDANPTTGDTLKSYYGRQSSGTYSITGTVHEWTRVDNTIAHYGTDSCTKGGTPISTYYCNEQLVTDGLDQWYANQLAAGRTVSAVNEYLASYDQWDRHDYDGDGIYNEPDGYLDRVMLSFAGESQANGGGVNGADAIGSHRGYVSYLQDGADTLGPDNGNLSGGSEVGSSGLWVDDYTMSNENRGLGVVAHEYGHDLGLPDLYDTSGGENSTGFWSVMTQGSGLTDKESLSANPADLGAWARLQLGWLDYETAEAATDSAHTINPLSVDSSTRGAEAVVVNLPEDADGNARYYVVENRRYVGDDVYLETGPYNLTTYSNTTGVKQRTNFAYEEGVLIWYWNTKYANNRTKTNGGYGRILPIDAHAEPEYWPSGSLVRNRVTSYDAAFGLTAVPSVTVHSGTASVTLEAKEPVTVFDDVHGTYHYDENPYGSSYDADSGTTIRVKQEYSDGRVKIAVGKSG